MLTIMEMCVILFNHSVTVSNSSGGQGSTTYMWKDCVSWNMWGTGTR